VSIGTASCIAGIFGMNLPHGLEETKGVFYLTVWAMVVTVLGVHGAMAGKMFGWGGGARRIQEEAERAEVMKR
jgi:hypothetical protein